MKITIDVIYQLGSEPVYKDKQHISTPPPPPLESAQIPQIEDIPGMDCMQNWGYCSIR